MMRGAMLRCRRSDDGAAAVEFALVVPLLCFLLFAIINYGYMLSFRQALSQAAAEGARAAAVAPPGLPDSPPTVGADSRKTRAVAAVNQALGSYGVSCSATGVLLHGTASAGTCTVSDRQACVGTTTGAKCVKITLSYTYDDDSLLPKFPGIGVLLPTNLSYTTEAEVG